MTEIRTTRDLRRIFAEYPELAAQIDTLRADVEQIATLNKNGAGTNDEIHDQYTKIADPATEVLRKVVSLMSDVSAKTGEDGDDVMRLFEAAENDSQQLAKAWDVLEAAQDDGRRADPRLAAGDAET
ncbi:hypothetical protein [Streptomyces sp. NPDC059080]|uniref:hypothetical protein n=1 Tax=Streptomyces sp. NPDC059080 TaxID=3346718 RepID=UPI00367CC9C3